MIIESAIAVTFLIIIFKIFYKEKDPKSDAECDISQTNHFSQVVLITCGDYRVAAFVRKYIKRIHEKWEMDILTTAGGARTIAIAMSDISLRNIFYSAWEYLQFAIKRWALWIDFEAYLGHGADTIVIANHKYCAKCPTFESDEAEYAFHITKLLKAREIVMKKYPEIKEVILLYVIIDKNTHEALEVIEISTSGDTKRVIIEEEERLAYVNNELEKVKQKRK